MTVKVFGSGPIVFTGQIRVTGVSFATEKVAVHDADCPQISLTVQVTVVAPPQASGATGVSGSIDILASQPPLYIVVASHKSKAALIAGWV